MQLLYELCIFSRERERRSNKLIYQKLCLLYSRHFRTTTQQDQTKKIVHTISPGIEWKYIKLPTAMVLYVMVIHAGSHLFQMEAQDKGPL